MRAMLDWVILIICILAGSLFAQIMKLAERERMSVLATGAVNYVVATSVCAITAAASGGFGASVSTVLLGTLNGVSFVATYFVLIRTLRVTGAAVPQILMRASVVVPTLFSVCVFNEELRSIQWFGLAILLGAFPLVGTRALEYRAIPRRKVIPLLGVLFVLTGAHGVVFKLFAESGAADEKVVCLLFIYGVAGVGAVAAAGMKRRRVGAGELRMGAAMGICNVLAGLPMLVLLERMSGALAFPLVSGGGVIGCLLLARFMLREQLTRRSAAGALLAAAALFLFRLG